MIINVTQDHINIGCERNSTNCPVALALTEATGQSARVNANSIYLEKPDGNDLMYESPIDVYFFVLAFDAGRFVQPFSFELGVGLEFVYESKMGKAIESEHELVSK